MLCVMELTEKKKEIMELSLNTRSNGVFIYKLLDSGCLDNALSMLTSDINSEIERLTTLKTRFGIIEYLAFVPIFAMNFIESLAAIYREMGLRLRCGA